MVEFILFLFSTFAQIIGFLDSFVIFEGITLFRLFVIVFFLSIILKFVLPKKE